MVGIRHMEHPYQLLTPDFGCKFDPLRVDCNLTSSWPRKPLGSTPPPEFPTVFLVMVPNDKVAKVLEAFECSVMICLDEIKEGVFHSENTFLFELKEEANLTSAKDVLLHKFAKRHRRVGAFKFLFDSKNVTNRIALWRYNVYTDSTVVTVHAYTNQRAITELFPPLEMQASISNGETI